MSRTAGFRACADLSRRCSRRRGEPAPALSPRHSYRSAGSQQGVNVADAVLTTARLTIWRSRGAVPDTIGGEPVNRIPSTHSRTRWIVRSAAAGLSTMGLLLAFQEIPAAAAQSRPAHAAKSSTVKHWGTFFGGTNAIKPEDTNTAPASGRLPGRVAEVASSNSSEYALLTNGSVYAWGRGN